MYPIFIIFFFWKSHLRYLNFSLFPMSLHFIQISHLLLDIKNMQHLKNISLAFSSSLLILCELAVSNQPFTIGVPVWYFLNDFLGSFDSVTQRFIWPFFNQFRVFFLHIWNSVDGGWERGRGGLDSLLSFSVGYFCLLSWRVSSSIFLDCILIHFSALAG